MYKAIEIKQIIKNCPNDEQLLKVALILKSIGRDYPKNQIVYFDFMIRKRMEQLT